MSLSTLGITGGYESSGYCEGTDCTGVDWSDLHDKVDSYDYWVKDAVSWPNPGNYSSGRTSGSNSNSCCAFYVCADIGEEGVNGETFRKESMNYALCK